MGPGTLSQLLRVLPMQALQSPELLVGIETIDDAGVYRLTDDIALIQTLDFFTPIVDDPYLFGQIAAANALSDIYAMGGRPLTAMNVVCFPTKKVDSGVLGEILRGGAEKIMEAGAVLVGGHSIEDEEPKYGLAVTGIAHPDKIVTNSGARPGDKLILTKPLGTGILATALKADMASRETEEEMGRWMAMLNRDAAAAMTEVGVHACTDITGFGLLGHCLELAQGSGVDVVLESREIPLLPGVLDFAAMGLVPGGAYNNRRYMEGKVHFDGHVKEALQDVLYDPQTSGGLLMAVAPEKVSPLLSELHRRGVKTARVIGEAIPGKGFIHVR
ncbi:MAG: selenide, water dikinase SelD [Thermoanaerobacteraceae bacterium]|nr:selenide, water dikinase SelD [Thermoanaerobacteraceae bacterium]GFN23249.1 selenide, water dikinase [Thermanaeromonas sp. C210]